MNTQHTPAPWIASQFGRSIAGPDGKSVCAISSHIKRSSDEKLANARLIAAAPDLLAALHYIAGLAEGEHADPHADIAQVASEARAVIAKAEGENTP